MAHSKKSIKSLQGLLKFRKQIECCLICASMKHIKCINVRVCVYLYVCVCVYSSNPNYMFIL